MKKLCLIFLTVSLIAVFMSSCSPKGEEFGEYFVDGAGITHLLVTDTEGKRVLDKNGDLIEGVLRADGAPLFDDNDALQTRVYDFPPFIYYAETRKIEHKYFSLTVPEGWAEPATTQSVILKNEEKGLDFDITVKEGQTYDEVSKSIKASAKDATDKNPDMKYVIEEITLSDTKTLRTQLTRDGIPNVLIGYLFEKNGNVFQFKCSQKTQPADLAGFEEIINSISFK